MLVAARRGGLEAEELALLEQAMPELKARAKDLNELSANADFLFVSRPLALDEKAAALLDGDARALLAKLHGTLSSVSEWTHDGTESAVKALAEAEGLKLGKLAQPLRAALTGRATSPGIFDVLVLLGQDESLARIGDQLDPSTVTLHLKERN